MARHSRPAADKFVAALRTKCPNPLAGTCPTDRRHIREFGFTVPVLVDTAGTLIAGHGRVLAAQSLGITEVPTMVADGWSAEQIRAYRIADNKLTLNAGWDDDALKFELAELQDCRLRSWRLLASVSTS